MASTTDDLLEVPGTATACLGCPRTPSSRQDSYTSSCDGSCFLTPSQYEISDVGSSYYDEVFTSSNGNAAAAAAADHSIPVHSSAEEIVDAAAVVAETIDKDMQSTTRQQQLTMTHSSVGGSTRQHHGLQRDNSTREADPSGRIFRYTYFTTQLVLLTSKVNGKKLTLPF